MHDQNTTAAHKNANGAPNLNVGPGFYAGMPAEQYFALPYCSNSRLGPLRQSGNHFKMSMEKPFVRSASMRMGSALDCLLLEPEAWHEWCVMEPGQRRDKRTTAYKEILERFDEDNILSDTEYRTVLRMKRAVEDHGEAMKILRYDGQISSQVAIVFDWMGVRMKSRLDRLIWGNDFAIGVDLKTTKDASPRGFDRACEEYGYARQCGIYWMGCEILDKPLRSFAFVVVENVAPHNVEIIEVKPNSLFLYEGRREAEVLVRKWRYLMKTQKFGSYSAGKRDADLPAWCYERNYERLYLSDVPGISEFEKSLNF